MDHFYKTVLAVTITQLYGQIRRQVKWLKCVIPPGEQEQACLGGMS
jgi:hypothetical protein